jgi:hypothetical protein
MTLVVTPFGPSCNCEGGESSFNQNNILRIRNISVASAPSEYSELDKVAWAINNGPTFVWQDFEIYEFVRQFSTGFDVDPSENSPTLYRQFYRVKNIAKGKYGIDGTISLTGSDIIKGVQEVLPSAQYDLGDILLEDVWVAANNSLEGPFVIAGTTIFVGIQDSTPKKWLFFGPDGLYGVGELQFEEQNFIELTETSVPAVQTAKPPFTYTGTSHSLALEDLGRLNIFTGENVTLTIDDETISDLASANNITCLELKILFLGLGSLTIVYTYFGNIISSTFYKDDLIFIVRMNDSQGWMVRSINSQFESLRSWVTPPQEDLQLGDYFLITATEDFRLDSAKITVETAPTGSSIICSITKNGVVVSGNIVIDINNNVSELLNYNSVAFVAGDKIGVKITQVGSTVPGQSLQILMNIKK